MFTVTISEKVNLFAHYNITMKNKNLSGQILIVLMLALAIISILLVIISRNARRDTIDQIQSEQYETYYSGVEQELFQIVSGGSDDCSLTTLEAGNCEIDLKNRLSSVNAATLKIEKKDVLNFKDLVVAKDKSITIDLLPDEYDGDLKFSWKGTVAWVVNIDYQVVSTGEYKTIQSIYDNSGIFDDSANIKNCIDFATVPDAGSNSFSFNIRNCLNKVGGNTDTAIAVRMKPISNSDDAVELTLIGPTTGLPPQAQIITATADIDDDLANSPSIQLELQIPTHNPSLEILDYALRTNKTVRKNY